jgi:hypothetical protein
MGPTVADGVDTGLGLVNPAAGVATLLDANTSYQMVERAAALPEGVDAGELDWREQGQHQVETTLRWASWASEWGVASPSVVRIGCVWTFGARFQNDGRYVADAYLYCVADSVGLGQTFSATAAFSPAPVEVRRRVARLSATVDLVQEYCGVVDRAYALEVMVDGDGTGSIQLR